MNKNVPIELCRVDRTYKLGRYNSYGFCGQFEGHGVHQVPDGRLAKGKGRKSNQSPITSRHSPLAQS